MDGDIAPLDEIAELADDHGAMTFVDDCHGEGVLGGGRGIVSHFDLQGKVTFEVGSFSKALGVQGGILAGSEEVRTHALTFWCSFKSVVSRQGRRSIFWFYMLIRHFSIQLLT